MKTKERVGIAGQALILLALVLGFLVSALGLVLDGGRLYFEKINVQHGATAAALDAAQELRRNRTAQTDWEPAALRAASLNGFWLDSYVDPFTGATKSPGTAESIEVNVPPLSGTKAGDGKFAEVIITRDVPTTFARFFGPTKSTVVGRAVSGLEPDASFCIYALDPAQQDSYKNNGTATFTTNCGIMVNSVEPSYAARDLGTGSCTSAPVVATTGGASMNSCATNVRTGIPQKPDPLGHLTEPAIPGWAPNPVTDPNTGVTTYFPGRYGTGPGSSQKIRTIAVNGGETAVFQPGLYYIESSMTINGGATASGADVTFFLGAPSTGNLSLSGTAMINFTAPTAGPTRSILFWSSRLNSANGVGHSVGRGDNGSEMKGAFYFPNEAFSYGGTPQSSIDRGEWNLLVARNVSIVGTADGSVAGLAPPPPAENPILVPVVVE